MTRGILVLVYIKEPGREMKQKYHGQKHKTTTTTGQKPNHKMASNRNQKKATRSYFYDLYMPPYMAELPGMPWRAKIQNEQLKFANEEKII